MMSKGLGILIVAFCALLGAIGQVFFKLASKSLKFDIIALATNWKLLIGLGLYGISTLLFLYALKDNNLSLLYPVVATSYVWVALFSVFLLNEQFLLYKWLGILLIIVGIGIIAL